jgi:hypothetical protein
MSKIFNDDLKLYNEEFPLKPILEQIEFIFDDLRRTFVRLTGNKYLLPARKLQKYVNRFPDPSSISFGIITRANGHVGPDTKVIHPHLLTLVIALSNEVNDH